MRGGVSNAANRISHANGGSRRPPDALLLAITIRVSSGLDAGDAGRGDRGVRDWDPVAGGLSRDSRVERTLLSGISTHLPSK